MRLLPLIAATTIFLLTPGAYGDETVTFVEDRCSSAEIPITDTPQFKPINDVTIVLNNPPENTLERCRVDFITEAATHLPDPQLLTLGHAFAFPNNPPPNFLCGQTLEGVQFTEVDTGFDESHVMPVFFDHGFSLHGNLTITPCVGTLAGQAFRLRNHCLQVECTKK